MLLFLATALTFVLDTLDWRVYRTLFDPTHTRPTYDYQRYDKVADLYAYGLVLTLFSGPIALMGVFRVARDRRAPILPKKR